MGAHRHGQGGTCPPSGNVEKFFLLQMLSKTSVNEIFIHHFEILSSASGALPPNPYRGAASGPYWGISVLQTPHFPSLEKSSERPWRLSLRSSRQWAPTAQLSPVRGRVAERATTTTVRALRDDAGPQNDADGWGRRSGRFRTTWRFEKTW